MKNKAGNETGRGAAVAHVSLLATSGGDTILAARRKGELHRAAIEFLAGVCPLVILDFAGIQAVTPSFFLGGPWALWERSHVEQYPVVANLPPGASDDLHLVASVKRTPLWAGKFYPGLFESEDLLGEVEGPDSFVLARVRRGAVSATELEVLDSSLSVTGWNNRLAGLWQKKVLARRKVGRMYLYDLPWRMIDG